MQLNLSTQGNINNLGAKIYGSELNIKTNTLNNTPTQKEGNTTYAAPIIAGRETVNIKVDTLNNNANPDRVGKFNTDFSNQSLILSQGTMNINTNTINNVGAIIESTLDMVIKTDKLNNKNTDWLTIKNKQVLAYLTVFDYNRG